MCRCGVAIASHFRGKSMLVIVKDGVTLEPIRLLYAEKGIQAIVADSEVATDLSEFRALEGGAVQRCQQLALEQLRWLARDLKPLASQVPHHRLTDASDDADSEWLYELGGKVFPSLAPGSKERQKMRNQLRSHVRTQMQLMSAP